MTISTKLCRTAIENCRNSGFKSCGSKSAKRTCGNSASGKTDRSDDIAGTDLMTATMQPKLEIRRQRIVSIARIRNESRVAENH
jgi:hypothetical protein